MADLTERYHDLDKKLSNHEEVCAERYGNIERRLGHLETLSWLAIGTLLVGFGLVTMKLLYGIGG